jgi:Xaa-Pro aminopeptidase
MEPLDAAMEKAGAGAYLLYASAHDPNMRYLSGFRIGDPVVLFKPFHGECALIVPQMEVERAVSESSCRVITRSEAGFFQLLEETGDPLRATARMIHDVAGESFLVPRSFPLGLARALEEYCTLFVDSGTVEAMRAVKSPAELAAVRKAQQAAEGAMDLALSLLRSARTSKGRLIRNGAPLTSEALRRAMHIYLLEHGCTATDTIVSCGPETAMPHRMGEGVLLENEPIVIDVFPRDEQTGYYADMTRTVVKGEPDPGIEEMYSAVLGAQNLAKGMIAPGIKGSYVHNAVIEYFKDVGYETGTEGFIHSLGHGVGLDVHEEPSLSPRGEELAVGNVVTVEPGLYYRGVGGIRLEDIGAVTSLGFECFTQYNEEIRL